MNTVNMRDVLEIRRRIEMQTSEDWVESTELVNVKKRCPKLEYKESMRPMGIYQIRNLVNEKVFVGSTLNLDSIFYRHLFQLNIGGYPNKPMQNNWKLEESVSHLKF